MEFLKKTCFLAVLLAAGCKLNPPDQDTIYDIPNEFTLELTEPRDSATGRADLGLRFSTTKLYPCENVKLEGRADWLPADVFISLDRIVQPAKCKEGNAPAIAFFSMADRAEGSYKCKLNLGGEVDLNGTLDIAADMVRVSFEQRAGVSVRRPSLNRIPSSTVWGWVGFKNDADLPTAQQFLAELSSLTAEPSLPAGYFGDFDWQSPTSFDLNLEKPIDLSTLDFVRTSAVPRAQLEALVKKYRDDAAHQLTILFWTGSGRI